LICSMQSTARSLSVGEANRMHVAAAERCGQPFPDHERDERHPASYRLGRRDQIAIISRVNRSGLAAGHGTACSRLRLERGDEGLDSTHRLDHLAPEWIVALAKIA
jgi:hypothetical protein